VLELNNICQEYIQGQSSIDVLSELNLSIEKRKNIGIIGPSGSGKTTLLNIIGLLENPTKGNITINGTDCNKLLAEQKSQFRKKNIGYIFQNNQLLEDFKVVENVALPLILNGESYGKSIKKSAEFLDTLGLKNRLNFKPALLSGGEQQRVAIARALIKKPLILLADEPTGSLDEKTSLEIFKFIIKLSKENKTLCIIATHNLKLIKSLDICYKIVSGKLVGNH